MKILLIARTCPYPPDDGEKLRVFNLIRHLSHHDITLVCRVMNENELRGVPVLEQYCRQVKYAFIPSPASNLIRLRWCFPFVFSRYPISLATVYFSEIAGILQELADDELFDIIQIEHSSLTVYLDQVEFANRPPKLLTLHNIDSIRNERLLRTMKWGGEKVYLYINQLRFRSWERASIRRYECIVTMSEKDRSDIAALAADSEVVVVPNGVDTDTLKPLSNVTTSGTLLFVASMDSESNHDGAIYFLKEIFPLVKSRYPKASVWMVGRRPRQELLDFHNGDDIIVTGGVPDVTEFYGRAVVAVVPLRSGGGTRLKILEAMAYGVPVVSTSIGTEGLHVENRTHLLIADEPSAFADALGCLFDDAELCSTLVSSARRLVEEEYDWHVVASRQDRIYQRLMGSAILNSGEAAWR